MADQAFTPLQWRRARREIEQLREEAPDATDAKLIRQVLKNYCLKVGATGAGTTAISLIPGFGRLLGWAVDFAGDAALTAGLQRELVLRIFAVHGREPNAADQVQMLAWIGAIGIGAAEVAEHVGGSVLRTLARGVLGRFLRRGLPVAQILAATASHVASTYIVGRRADAYCKSHGLVQDDEVELDPRRIRNWTMLSLGTVIDDDKPKTVNEALNAKR